MTREEERKQIAKEYRKYRESCGVVDPVVLNEIEDAHYDGYICAEKTIIEKACEWLYLQLNEINMEGEDMENFLKDFKNYMKGK